MKPNIVREALREVVSRNGVTWAPFPNYAVIEVNYDCQSACVSCALWRPGYKAKRLGERSVLTKQQVEDAIKQLAEGGCLGVYFCGGEPFIRKDLIHFIRIAHQLGLHTSTTSNGGLLRNEKIVS